MRVWQFVLFFVTLGSHIPPAGTQTASVPFDVVKSTKSIVSVSEGPPVIITEEVGARGAAWVQLRFTQWDLGESLMTISSVKDGASQVFTAQALNDWHGESAAFNGDKIVIRLELRGKTLEDYAESGRKPDVSKARAYYSIKELVAGKHIGSLKKKQRVTFYTLCGNDDRLPSSDPRVGRLFPKGCTGWLIQTGALLTAGHCAKGLDLLQFNVPKSLSDGTPVMPSPQDQYKIKKSSVVYRNERPGKDWAIFTVWPNSQTGKLPMAAQGGRGFSVSDVLRPTQVRVTGYGIDKSPPGSSGRYNEQSKTLQSAFGDLTEIRRVDDNRVVMRYLADTEPANSGSPVIAIDDQGRDTDVAIGIHTTGGCSSPARNRGTSFRNKELMKAINDFLP